MKPYFKHRRMVLTLLGVAVCALTAVTRADDPPDAGNRSVSEEEVIREQTIYIPYTKLRTIFEKEGRGVFLPYEEFHALWRAARDNTRAPLEDGPPVSALITEAENEATVSEDVIHVSSRLTIELLVEGWIEIPLHLGDAAITKATLGDRPARLLFEPGTGYKLLVKHEGSDAKVLNLSLEFVKAFTKTPGRNNISFKAPQAPVSRWRIHIPESGVKIDIRPLIAATQVPDDAQPDPRSEETVVLAFVGAAPSVSIAWTPKSEGATGLEALANVQAEQQVTVDEGVIRTRTRLVYDISRAAATRLLVEVPATHKIVNVFDPNIRQWSVENVAGAQHITAELFEPVMGTQSVTVELQKFTGTDEWEDLKVPVIRALGTGRQQGVVVVKTAEGLRAEVTRHTDLLQVDSMELPASLAKKEWDYSYRYVSLPFDLSLRVQKVKPRITVDSLIEVDLRPERITLQMLAICQVERAGVFRFELDIPADYEVLQVRGRSVPGAQPAQVDTHHLEGDDQTHLVVNLSRKAFGPVALALTLQKRLAEPDLLTPTGRAVDLPLDIPRMSPATVARVSGRLILRAPESLRVNPREIEGLRSISFVEALAGRISTHNEERTGLRSVLAYAYTQEEVRLTLAVERRKPHVTARQLLLAQVKAGVIEYTAMFFYDIRYSGVETLRIDIPADLAAEIRNKTPGVREREIEPPPDDLPEGYVAWSLAGETEFMGEVTLRLAWEEKIEEIKVGKSVERSLPHLRPAAVDRAWGQIVLVKTETLDVRATGTPQGVRPIDPQHDLMAGADVAGGALAFEFHDDWSLSVEATRYQLEEVKRTSIERAVVQMVLTRSGQTSIQALYRMRSARQRLAVQLPEDVDFDNEPLRINGRPIPLERGDKNDYFIPLTDLGADEPFLLELRYSVSGRGTRLDCPVFPTEPAVQKVYLCAYVPKELAYLGSIGPWTDELAWRWTPVLNYTPSPLRHAVQLIAWATEGLNITGNPASTFQTDGRLYLFSALRPAAGTEGSLRLVMLDEDWLSGLVLVPILLAGLLLLRTKPSIRLLAGGAFVVFVLLVGVFFPTLLRQIVDDRMLCAVLIVVLIWLIHYLVWIRPSDPLVAARKKARTEAAVIRIKAKAAATVPTRAVKAEPPPKKGGGESEKPPRKNEEKGGRSDA